MPWFFGDSEETKQKKRYLKHYQDILQHRYSPNDFEDLNDLIRTIKKAKREKVHKKKSRRRKMEEKDEDLTEEIFDLLEQLGMIPRGYTAEPPRQEDEYEDEDEDEADKDQHRRKSRTGSSETRRAEKTLQVNEEAVLTTMATLVQKSSQPGFISIFVTPELQSATQQVGSVASMSLRAMLESQLADVIRKASTNYEEYLDAINTVRDSITTHLNTFTRCGSIPEAPTMVQKLTVMSVKLQTAAEKFVDVAALKKELADDAGLKEALRKCNESLPVTAKRAAHEKRLNDALHKLERAVTPGEDQTAEHKRKFRETYEDWKSDHRALRQKLKNAVEENRRASNALSDEKVEDLEKEVDDFETQFSDYMKKWYITWKLGNITSWLGKNKIKTTSLGAGLTGALWLALKYNEGPRIYGGTRKNQRI
jgi:hypothetical protein